MKSIPFLLTLLLFISLQACKNKNSAVGFPLDTANTLKVTRIYWKDSVLAFSNTFGDRNKELAEQYAQKGEVTLDSDFKKSNYYFKRALTLFPDESIYRRYGNALFEKGKHEEANEPYDLLLKLNPAQSSDQYLKIIRNYLTTADGYGMYTLLHNFREQNYSLELLTENILQDEKIKTTLSPAQLRSFQSAINSVWEIPSTVEEGAGAPFEEYVKQFEPVTFPFSVNKKELQRFVYERSFEGEFDEYDPTTDFSRFKENEFFRTKYYCKTDFQYLVKEASGLTVLIHAADSSGEAVPGDIRCIYHRLIVYDSSGKLVDSKIIGVHAGDVLTTYKISEDLNVYTETFSRQWKKPFLRYEIDNEILSTSKMGEAQYKITEKGEISELPLTQ